MITLSGQDLADVRQWLDANRERLFKFDGQPDLIENGWGQGDVLAAHEELYAATAPAAGGSSKALAKKSFDLSLSLTAEMLAKLFIGSSA